MSSQSNRRSAPRNSTLELVNLSQGQSSLLAVSRDLSTNQHVDEILDMILERAVEYTTADAGTIFLVEQLSQDSLGGARPAFRHVLRFYKIKNMTNAQHPPSPDNIIEISEKSIVGFAAVTGRSVRVRDCYLLPEEAPFKFNKDVDKYTGYRTKSILTIPIKTNKNSVIGVLQLINKMRPFRRSTDVSDRRNFERDTIAFSENDEKLIEAFASHAAIALENAKLTSDIARLFESFVKASVSAIEARDPTTSGHSDRVAKLTVRFAEVVDSVSDGPFSDVRFSEIQLRELRYAALLHDFGKIGVRENVLLKAKKLYPQELESVLLRLDSLRHKNETQKWRETCERITQLAEKGALAGDAASSELGHALMSIDAFNKEIEDIRRGILVANESQILDKDFNIVRLMTWIQQMSQKMGLAILSGDEAKRLSIARGTLSLEERLEIESHVSYTYEFLRQIAWTEDLANVPDIAHAHHEKLDGTGYPRQLRTDQIPVQARIMAISDIFDALTAMDRPYKKAVSHGRALDILHDEASSGKLDMKLLKVFQEAEVYKVVTAMGKSKKSAA